jgi:hypothetical protein
MARGARLLASFGAVWCAATTELLFLVISELRAGVCNFKAVGNTVGSPSLNWPPSKGSGMVMAGSTLATAVKPNLVWARSGNELLACDGTPVLQGGVQNPPLIPPIIRSGNRINKAATITNLVAADDPALAAIALGFSSVAEQSSPVTVAGLS